MHKLQENKCDLYHIYFYFCDKFKLIHTEILINH